MTMQPYLKMQRSAERARRAKTKAKERKQDIQDLKDRDLWQDPRTQYLDEYGYILPDAPQWCKNLRKAWHTNDRINTEKKAIRALDDEEPQQVPKTKKKYKKVIRIPMLKHSEKMRLLLEDHGIYVGEDGMLSDEFSDFRFCRNGRLKKNGEPTISVFYFLQQYADT